MKNIVLLLFLALQSCISSAQTFEGTWRGDLHIQGQQLPLVFALQQENKVWKGTLQSPAQSQAKMPISNILVQKDSILIDVKGIGLSFQGLLKGDTLKGLFSQGGLALPLVLTRSVGPNEERPIVRTQVVVPPYPYDTAAVVITNAYDNIKLAGTLTFPKKKGKYPAVLLLTGSGPQDRNEAIFNHKPFQILADYLTRNGIVVLRVDDRGVGESGGSFENSTIENFSKDAISAFKYLQMQPQVDGKKVGIIGHSEGGLIAELLAGQHLPGLSYIVSLAGPSFSIDKLMEEQLYAVGKAAGMSEQSLAQARKINAKNFEIVKSNLGTEEAYQKLVENMSLSNLANNKQMERELLTMLAPAYRYFMRIEPELYLAKINIPVFAAFGSLDIQVPADSNLKSLHDLLPKHPKNVLKEYVGMNHLFQKATTGQLAEYADIEETINPQVMHDIAAWIKGL